MRRSNRLSHKSVNAVASTRSSDNEHEVYQKHQVVRPVPFIGSVEHRKGDGQGLRQADDGPKSREKANQQERGEPTLDEKYEPPEDREVGQNNVLHHPRVRGEYRVFEGLIRPVPQATITLLPEVGWDFPGHILHP